MSSAGSPVRPSLGKGDKVREEYFGELYRQVVKELEEALPGVSWPSSPPEEGPPPAGQGPDLLRLIDHTALKPETTATDIRRLCEEALTLGFYSVCVSPCWVKLASSLLEGSPVRVCTVIGFPHGTTTTLAKVTEAVEAVAGGAAELDMVLNVGALKGRDLRRVWEDIARVREAAGEGRVLKVILETSLLEDREKILGALVAVGAGADFVKTSTGFGGGGATAADVNLLRRTVGSRAGVKASGGIRNLTTALDMVRAGANRIGTSSGVRIARELAASKGEK
ncbi:MAG: deoxyribose-phosphate aldolase [Thermoanaerobacteraceae bacterium]|nr:deoxyribose-phosphate aldolase [Thermoanaerobacteraceae bacterium]